MRELYAVAVIDLADVVFHKAGNSRFQFLFMSSDHLTSSQIYFRFKDN